MSIESTMFFPVADIFVNLNVPFPARQDEKSNFILVVHILNLIEPS
ncbi:MAG: hypothetical protein ACE5SW_12440 [Nitrososphaeraceae archaeon]